jgi:hypothetical protein
MLELKDALQPVSMRGGAIRMSGRMREWERWECCMVPPYWGIRWTCDKSGQDGDGSNEKRGPEQVHMDTASGGMRTEKEYARLRLAARFFSKEVAIER